MKHELKKIEQSAVEGKGTRPGKERRTFAEIERTSVRTGETMGFRVGKNLQLTLVVDPSVRIAFDSIEGIEEIFALQDESNHVVVTVGNDRREDFLCREFAEQFDDAVDQFDPIELTSNLFLRSLLFGQKGVKFVHSFEPQMIVRIRFVDLPKKFVIRTKFVQILVRILSNQRGVEIGAEEEIRHRRKE